jgi:hypothetical protein
VATERRAARAEHRDARQKPTRPLTSLQLTRPGNPPVRPKSVCSGLQPQLLLVIHCTIDHIDRSMNNGAKLVTKHVTDVCGK